MLTECCQSSTTPVRAATTRKYRLYHLHVSLLNTVHRTVSALDDYSGRRRLLGPIIKCMRKGLCN